MHRPRSPTGWRLDDLSQEYRNSSMPPTRVCRTRHRTRWQAVAPTRRPTEGLTTRTGRRPRPARALQRNGVNMGPAPPGVPDGAQRSAKELQCPWASWTKAVEGGRERGSARCVRRRPPRPFRRWRAGSHRLPRPRCGGGVLPALGFSSRRNWAALTLDVIAPPDRSGANVVPCQRGGRGAGAAPDPDHGQAHPTARWAGKPEARAHQRLLPKGTFQREPTLGHLWEWQYALAVELEHGRTRGTNVEQPPLGHRACGPRPPLRDRLYYTRLWVMETGASSSPPSWTKPFAEIHDTLDMLSRAQTHLASGSPRSSPADAVGHALTVSASTSASRSLRSSVSWQPGSSRYRRAPTRVMPVLVGFIAGSLTLALPLAWLVLCLGSSGDLPVRAGAGAIPVDHRARRRRRRAGEHHRHRRHAARPWQRDAARSRGHHLPGDGGGRLAHQCTPSTPSAMRGTATSPGPSAWTSPVRPSRLSDFATSPSRSA